MSATISEPESKTPTKADPDVSFLQLKGVCKSYGEYENKTSVLKDINLEVEKGEFICLLGFSGSGKTTLMQILAGILDIDQGEATLEGKPIKGPDPSRGLVFQNYSLLPWLNVLGNVRLSVDKVFPELSASERNDHALKYIEKVNLTPALQKKPHELSGGMRQRVSLARTLAMCPDVLLLDEPLSALDALTRSVLQIEISRIWAEEKTTVLMVTNDVDEAILLADRIIPLKPGPNASLGQEFAVNLPRPRDSRELNSNEAFIELRNSITHYLVEVRKESVAAAASSGVSYKRPTATPRNLDERSPAINN